MKKLTVPKIAFAINSFNLTAVISAIATCETVLTT